MNKKVLIEVLNFQNVIMITYGFWVPNFRCCKWERSTAIFLQLCWWYCHLKLLDGLYRVATFLLYRKVLTHVRLKRLTEVSCIWYCCTWEANVTVRETGIMYDRSQTHVKAKNLRCSGKITTWWYPDFKSKEKTK